MDRRRSQQALRATGIPAGATAFAVTCVAVAFLAAAFLWPPSQARADDTSLGGVGGAYYPLANTDVRMASETVQVICYRHFAEYKVDFLFTNTGQAQTLQLGFPFATDPEDPGSRPAAFRAWQDGRPLAVSIGKGAADSYQDYFLHQATFPTGRTKITVSYLARASWVAGDRFPELTPPEMKVPGLPGTEGIYEYWLHTGAGWAGTIGKAVVRFTLADDFAGFGVDIKAASQPSGEWLRTTRPETYTKVGDRTYQWIYTNLEPAEKDDIVFEFSGIAIYPGDVETVPPALGAVASSITTSNPATSDPDWLYWSILDVSPDTGIALKGEHPWVQLGIGGDTRLQEIRILPGNNEAVDSFAQYARPKTVKVTLSDGTGTTITLADEPSYQRFPISGTADWVRLDVIDSYPGTKGTDVYLSDVSFGNELAPAFESFDNLIAVTGSTTATTSATGPTAGTASISVTAGAPTTAATTATQVTPATWQVTTGPTGNTAAGEGRAIVWTGWTIALLVVACVCLLTAVTLGVLLARRHRSDRGSGPPGTPPDRVVS